MPEETVTAYARTRHFGERTLARWLECEPSDREALLAVAEALRLGENQFRDVFDQAREIAARRRWSISQVLDVPPIREVLARSSGRNEALRALKQSLRRLRYPQLAEVEQKLAAKTKALRLPAGVEVRFPENLEGEGLWVHLRAKSAAQLRKQVEELAAAIGRAELDEVFRLLEGDW